MSRIWEGHKLVACLGTGGVGKTTVSATIAVAAAHHGLKTLVMTIDPARRLADALGLKDIGNTERQVEPELFEPYGFELRAPLWVMMPDVKQTFDGVISRLHSSPDAQNNILNNRFYTQLSTAIAGAQEYAAVEKLYEVVQSGQYDLIVLDTPPSQNAIDFLDAPGKMIDFLEHESLQWLIKPYSVAGKLSLRMLDVSGNLLHRWNKLHVYCEPTATQQMSRYPQPLLEFDLGGVITTLLHEFVVAAAVGNRAILQDEDFIGVAHRA